MDRFVELSFQSSLAWRSCFVSYAIDGQDNKVWHKLPMDMRTDANGSWFQRIEAPRGIVCAFNDGGSHWDNSKGRNYEIRLPGKYILGGGHMVYCGVSDLDVHFS